MPRSRCDQDLLPSVLDRLIDRESKVFTANQAGRPHRLAPIMEVVKRDLEWLLRQNVVKSGTP